MKGRVLVGALALVAGFGGSVWTTPAEASADSTCYPEWTLYQQDYGGCSGSALMGPANDTRVNLLMLLYDRHGAVGPTDLAGNDWDGRFGDARPFDYYTFAEKLAGQRRTPLPAEGYYNYPDSFGTRCNSNETASAAFIAALASTRGLPPEERGKLTEMRRALVADCTAEPATGPIDFAGAPQGFRSRQGKDFATYLFGAAAFYRGAWDEAESAFRATARSDTSWVADAGGYMVGRTALNRAMESAFDEYGWMGDTPPDSASLDAAEAGFADYLKANPQGQYGASARGLLRKVYWLGKNENKLLAEYLYQFGQPAGRRDSSLADLVQEFDGKLLGELEPSDVSDPVVLAALDLKAMRNAQGLEEWETVLLTITRADIVAQKPKFRGQEAPHSYLLASYAWFVDGDAQETLRLLGERDESGATYFAFSRGLLQVSAMDSVGDPRTRDAMLALIDRAELPFQRASAELALALHDERHQGLDRVFAAGSPITDPEIREILLRYTAGPDLLRRTVSQGVTPRERTVANYVLLYKQLTRGRYADFGRDLALRVDSQDAFDGDETYGRPAYMEIGIFDWEGSTDFVCPAIADVARSLAANPAGPRGLLCLGEFVRLKGLDPDYYGVPELLDERPSDDQLGGGQSQFPGTRFSRLDAYKAIMTDARAPAEDRAYALYRAVHCYAPSGNNGCDASDQPEATRRGWFQRLKRDYPNSRWAKDLKYYW